MIRYTLLAGMIFLLNACTTIEIAERDAFDVKRTILAKDFKDTEYTLNELHIPSDSLLLETWWITQPDAKGTVLYYGGNGFVREVSYNIIHSILGQNMNLMVFNYRGYGRNKGKPSISGLKQDGLAAYQYMRDSLRVDPSELVIHGHSLGTFVATYVKARREAAGLVLQSPLTNADDMTKALVPWFLRPLVKFDIDERLLAEDNISEIKKIEQPLLFICGTKDHITPPTMAETLYKEANAPDKRLEMIKGGGHNDLDERNDYQRNIRKFYHGLMKE